MKEKSIILIIICVLSFAFSPRQSIKYKGTASDLQSGEFYYTEEHEEFRNESVQDQTMINFRDTDEKIIVTKTIDYSKSTVHPDFIQQDVRDGYMESAETINGITELKCRKNFKSKTESKSIHIPQPAVIDGGFTYFVKANWDRLSKGDVVKFNFAVPSQLDYYTFRMYKKDEKMIGDKNTISFKMEPDQFFVRALVKPIIIIYDTSTKRLMQYEGISNINDAKGKSYEVRINYPVIGP